MALITFSAAGCGRIIGQSGQPPFLRGDGNGGGAGIYAELIVDAGEMGFDGAGGDA